MFDARAIIHYTSCKSILNCIGIQLSSHYSAIGESVMRWAVIIVTASLICAAMVLDVQAEVRM
jgi:hypothetical protein